MENFRQEKDSLGLVDIPKNALYGAQTTRALNNFQVSGKTAHPALTRAYLHIKSAAARANTQADVLNAANADLIIRAIDQLMTQPDGWANQFPVDPYQAGAGTNQNMNVNEVIANTANQLVNKPLGSYSPIHPNDHVNRSQSTNDTYPTAMRLALLELSNPLISELKSLSQSLQSKATEFDDFPKAARTHLQDAVPIRLGQEFSAYSRTVQRCHEWLEGARDGLRELGIGGSAAGTGLTVPKQYSSTIIRELEKLTGEKLFLSPNLCEAMQSQSPITYYSSMLRLIALELTRICNDLRLLASGPLTGLAEITLPPVQPGSSIMPGKVNPSILEMVNQTCYSIIGYDQTVSLAAQAGQLELNVMMPIMAYATIEATIIATHAIRILRTKCIQGIGANEPKLRHYFESTPQIATALSPKLGYELTAQLVQESLRSGKSVLAIVREQNLVTEEELTALTNYRALT